MGISADLGIVRASLSLAMDRVVGDDITVKEARRKQLRAMIDRVDAMIRGDRSNDPTAAELRELLGPRAEDDHIIREALARWDD